MTDAKILVDDLGQGRGIDVSAEAIADGGPGVREPALAVAGLALGGAVG
ncbi:MAG: hypothetical protein V9E99_14270 [Microthrixaceae bacterium]